jgi:adenosylhomocysteine nucleosidase
MSADSDTDRRARVLILTAMPEERAALWRRRLDRDVVIAATGEGPRKAARAAALLCAGHRPALLVGAGVAGALSTDLGVGDILIGRRVLDAAGAAPPPDAQLVARAAAMPGVRLGTLLTVDRPLVAAAEKAEWAAKVGEAPAAVDMESAAWARVAAAHGISYVMIRAVSDDAFEELPGYLSRCMDRDGGIRRWAVAMHAIAQPSTIPKLRQMQRRVRDCTDRLAAFVEHFLAGTV